MGKRSLGRPKLRWEDYVKDVKNIEPEINWREASEDRDRWQVLYLEVWFLRPKSRGGK